MPAEVSLGAHCVADLALMSADLYVCAWQVENVMTVFRNMMHLINSLRPHQVR